METKPLARYRLEASLGSGAMGTVYRAWDQQQSREVALKLLKPSASEEDRRRFREEARVLTRIHHPNLIKIYDFHPEVQAVVEAAAMAKTGLDLAAPLPCFAMEYLPFPTLDRWPGTLTAESFLEILAQTLQGLNYLHARGILHRDLKPTNIVVTEAKEIKILDFGLAQARREEEATASLGTLAYQAPETYVGLYDTVSDLFSLGVLAYEILTGRLPYPEALTDLSQVPVPTPLRDLRPDLPDYLTDLLQRMIDPQPDRRPSSAASILRVLQRHLPDSSSVQGLCGAEGNTLRPNFVAREQELSTLQEEWKKTQSESLPRVLTLHGPTGVGRSRLLEEWLWRLRLAGQDIQAIGPERGGTWFQAGEVDEPVAAMIRLLKNADGRPRCLQFTDLHLWPQEALRNLPVFLALLGDFSLPWCCLLEWNDDLFSETEQKKILPPTDSLARRNLPLGDLDEDSTLALIGAATPEDPLPKAQAKQIASQSGGRPLLVLELLQELRAQDRRGEPGKKRAALPENLREATRLRLSRLSSEALRLLAMVLTQDENGTPELWAAATSWSEEKIVELEEELRAEAWLQRRGGEHLLRHPSLAKICLTELNRETLDFAHRTWLHYWLQRSPQAVACPEAEFLTRHALAVADGERAKKFGFAAAEYCQRRGRESDAVNLYEQLLPYANTPFERSFLQAHLAPAYYRQAEYEKSQRAYDLWYRDREDDESRLQALKYRFYTGLVQFSAGNTGLAKQSFDEAFQIGDGERYPAHRTYLVRAHNLYAALAEKNREAELALSHLRRAEALAAGVPLSLGEIEHRLGRWHQDRLAWREAETHFRDSVTQYQKAGNPQGEGIAWNALAMLCLSEGRLEEGLKNCQAAQAAASSGRDRLQEARYRENSALLAMARGDYGIAETNFAEARLLLEILGQESDKLLIPLHRLQWALFVGNLEQAAYWQTALEKQSEALKKKDYWLDYQLALADGDLLRGDRESARQRLGASLADGAEAAPYDQYRAMFVLFRSHWSAPEPSPSEANFTPALLPDLPGPLLELGRSLAKFFSTPKLSDQALLGATLQAIQSCENPELRLESYRLLAQRLKQQNFTKLSEALREAARTEWQNLLFNLPEELQMDFEKNRGLDQLEENLQKLLPQAKAPAAPPAAAVPTGAAELQVSEARFRQFSEINRQIAEKTDLKELLDRVMDAAIEFTGAERGFLLLKKNSEDGDGPENFEVRAARHLSQHNLKTEEFSLSMSAVRKVVESGNYLLTDNARLDPRFHEKQSVVLHQLTSILVVPLEQSGRIHGAIYLDHRLQPGCFKKEDILLLNAFASQAALAIQKARLVDELRQANEKLNVEVRDQAQHIQALAGELAEARDKLRYEYSEIVGQSPPMMQVFQLLDHVTATSIPVWIWGESGTGKELVARSLHENSPRKKGPFVSENCSAIPENLLESELFGHKRGAFTHADRDRIGLLEQASGGTLFLDEVADMSLGMQAKLLRAFQEGEIRPLGSGKKVKVDVRLVTASNRNLAQMVQEETFRQDLFFRINGLTIRLPPLRERKTDIPLLVEAFMKKLSKQFGLPPSEMTEAAYQAMYQYTWPGNIRELESVVRNALLFAKGKPIGPELLALNFAAAAKLSSGSAIPPNGVSGKDLQKEKILSLLRTHGLDKEKVAQELGISLRSLYTWLEKMGVPKKKSLLARYLETWS